MKNLISFLLGFLFILPLSAYEITVERPPFSVRNIGGFEIEKIVLTDQNTTFFITNYQQPGWWFRIVSDTYIRVNGEKLLVQKAEGINLDEEIYMDDSGKKEYKLIFPAIDPETERIDIIESDCEDCFKVWGLELKSQTLTNRIELPEEIKNLNPTKNDNAHLNPVGFNPGKATIKGEVLGYVPDLGYEIEIYVNNAITGEQEPYYIKVNEEGKFNGEVPVPTTMQVLFRINRLMNNYILITPQEETTIYIDLQQKGCQEATARIDKCPQGKWLYFGGANANINNEYFDHELSNYERSHFDYGSMMNDIAEMNLQEYKEYILNKRDKALEGLSAKNISLKTKELMELSIKFSALYYLRNAKYMLEGAYRNKNNISYEEKLVDYTPPVFDLSYFDFLDNELINNPKSLHSENYSFAVSSLRYIMYDLNPQQITRQYSYIERLIQEQQLTPEELEYAEYHKSLLPAYLSNKEVKEYKETTRDFIKKLQASGKLNNKEELQAQKIITQTKNKGNNVQEISDYLLIFLHELQTNGNFTPEEVAIPQSKSEKLKHRNFPQELFESFNEKYDESLSRYAREETQLNKPKQLLKGIIGTDQGILFDLMATQLYASGLEEATPLNEYALKQLANLEPNIYYTYLSEKNNDLIARIEENKKKQKNVYEIPDTEEDMILYEIIKPFEGKVIMIDFWATWCGPCRSAMKDFEPTKEQFKDKDVAFLYLADESSPLGTWENMIGNIDGEHFRLKNNQSQYLHRKYGVRGIPAYLILNKKGEQIYFKTGFEGSTAISKILNKALEEE